MISHRKNIILNNMNSDDMLKIGCLYKFKQSRSIFCWTDFKNFQYLTGVHPLDVTNNKPFIVVSNGPVMEPEFVRVIYEDQLVWIRAVPEDVSEVI